MHTFKIDREVRMNIFPVELLMGKIPHRVGQAQDSSSWFHFVMIMATNSLYASL